MRLSARLYLGVFFAAGLPVLLWQVASWRTEDPMRFAAYLAITLLASGLKVPLPRVTGTMSVYFLLVLLGVMQLSVPETTALAVGAVLVQCYWKAKKRPTPVQLLFNISSAALTAAATHAVFHWQRLAIGGLEEALRLAVAAIVFFLMNTGPVAIVIALTEGKSAHRIWTECYFWCFPYYLLGASIVEVVAMVGRAAGWQTAMLALPVVYTLYRSYRVYLARLEGEKSHAEEVALLHLRTIEALALAIDAKDHSTHAHLKRVQVYALEVAKELELPEEECAALQAAALLHDIGKLAVPEHIISKPGKLTPEEFEKMKIHPVVGAEILDRVKFPYPVGPIVRSHHEKWNGTGYPDGLKGEQIPMGARILAAVDCLDALSTDRQYRRALPLEEALAAIVAESGESFDPLVVDVLERLYLEIERKVKAAAGVRDVSQLSTGAVIERGEQPDAGFERSAERPLSHRKEDFLSSIAAARQEAQALFELAQSLGNSLRLSDTLSMFDGRLKRLVPYDAIVVYVASGATLKPQYVAGEDSKLFSSLEIPIGQGLAGWVAEKRRGIINGNPSVEPGYLHDPKTFSKLNSSLAVPLEEAGGVVGVLSLYRAERDAFSRDELRIVQAISSKLAVALGNALRYEQAESSATTDYLTSLPNARSLFLHLDSEIARCGRAGRPVAVLVCDLDGFKRLNDRYGHLAGNDVLVALASGLKATCRRYDYIARMGGDEFVLIMPDVTPEAAAARVEDFDRIARGAGVAVCNDECLGLSVGISFFPQDGSTAEDLLAEADRRMYRHKSERRASRELMNLAGPGPAPAAAWQREAR